MKTHHRPAAILALFLLPLLAGAAPKKPAFTLELLAPATDVLSAQTEVRVGIGSGSGEAAPTAVYCSLGGPLAVLMNRDGDSGAWVGILDTTMVPNGTARLEVITNDNRTRLAADFTVDNPLRHYFADLHSHTGFSDGTLLPKVAHDYARNVAGLDVFCLTDHLESVDDGEWRRMREVAWKANEDGAFVAFPGLEWTKKWGHVNLYDPGTRHWPKDPEAFCEAIAAAEVLAEFNHPGEGTRAHAGLAYSEAGDRAVQLMEVRSEKEEKAFIRALPNGWHIAPEGSDDTHAPN